MLDTLIAFDRWLFVVINQGLGSRALDGVMLPLTYLGAWTIGFVTLAVVSEGGRRAFWRVHAPALLLGGLIALPLNPRLKLLADRDRPRGIAEQQQVEGGTFTVRAVEKKTHKHGSFPSGHSASAFFFMTYAALYRKKGKRWFYLLAGTIAFSRVYVGQHFPFDVIGGSLLGGAEGWAAWTLGQRWFAKQAPCVGDAP